MNNKQYATELAKQHEASLNKTPPNRSMTTAFMAEIGRWMQRGEVSVTAHPSFTYWHHEIDGAGIIVPRADMVAVAQAIGTTLSVTVHPQHELLLIVNFADHDAAEKWLKDNEPIPVTRFDIDRILGIGDQFLRDWRESDRESGEPTDAALTERDSEWRVVRPLLVSSADLARQLAHVVELAHAAGCDHEQLREANDLLENLRDNRALPPVRNAVAMQLTLDHWKTVLACAIQAGNVWRPNIVIAVDETKEGGAYAYKDCRDDGAKWSRAFPTLDALVVDVFAHYELDSGRLDAPEVGLDRDVVQAVRDYVAAIDFVDAVKLLGGHVVSTNVGTA